MSAGSQTQALLRLMAWMSPAFPIGGFAYSGGLERAVHDRVVIDARGLRSWLATLLRHGSFWNDAVLFCEAWRRHEDQQALQEVAELGLALAGSAERHFETLSLGKAFVAGAQAWPSEVFARLPRDLPFPVAVGAVAGAHGVAVSDALAAYLQAGLSQAVSAAIRLGACGQTEGVAILAGIEQDVLDTVTQAAQSTLDDLGTATVQAEICSLRHETQHSRLFRS
ncbi:urease accessory protein UreF [Neorhizobium sp. T786]|uniref:urease accessory protein UreF n=1 Tax=Pseudorhizobium xiangyangii TaxID=2883104 RepID=UPI001D00075D|nr:urease accessory protein UreF [Neorhizobium xiangyangii]MCB5205196.1 urease accessory protein UreF [Neorhizobium xiangyangii]